MIKINSRIHTHVLNQIRRCLSLSKTGYQTVTISTNLESTSIRVTLDEASLTCVMPRGGQPASIRLPLHVLCSIKPSSRHDVEFRPSHVNKAYIRFHEAGGITELPAAMPPMVPEPPDAEWLTSNDRSLGATLVESAQCTDGDSSRYSLGYLRLRCTDGQIAATDGRQAFTASGFTLPSGELLIPAEPLSKLDLLRRCSGISVGRSKEWLTLVAAVSPHCWRVDLRINDKSRFPNVDQCVPSLEASRFALQMHESDAEYLLNGADSLFGQLTELDCVTLDLEETAIGRRATLRLRVAKDDQRQQIELELARSTFIGGNTRVAFDLQHLLSALRLGFRRFHLQSVSGTPMFCVEGQRRFVCTTMHPSMVLLPAARQTRVSTANQVACA